jgi:hypothetical protein
MGRSASKNLVSIVALLALFVSIATAGSETHYTWLGWRMTDTEYAIVHSVPKDPTDNDFYLVCQGGRDQVHLAIRALSSGGYGGPGYANDIETDFPTTFEFGKKRIAVNAALRGPAEMLGGIHVEYVFERDDPVLAAIARGEPFRVVLPKTTAQLFDPKAARRFFEAMASHCKVGP